MLVVAGAGTGKTQVITRRIARLVQEGRAKSEEILALTFTDKAAGEMLDRLDGLIGWEAYRVNVMTFHAFGAQVLQRYGHHAGLPTTGEIIPEIGKVLLISQHLSKIKLSYYGNDDDIIGFCTRIVAYIEALQNADISVEHFASYVASLKQSKAHQLDLNEAEDHLELYRLYEAIKHKYRLIDYNDQIVLPVKLLTERPNILERLRMQYKYVLVDEYQDTNAAQDELLRLVVPPGGNIFAVGDDDQAIYGFRGARLGNILGFSAHFGVAEPMVLTRNYRSTQQILDASYRMIRHNDPERLEVKLSIDKHLRSDTMGPEPQFQAYPDAASEYEAVAKGLAARVKAGLATESLAVLGTSHRVLRAEARALRRLGLPYRLVSTINIFEQREVLQLWHLLRWIGLVASDEAIMNLMHGPFIDWSSDRVRKLVDISRKQLISLEEALEISAQTDAKSLELASQLKAWRGWAKELSVGHLSYRLVFESGLGQTWAKQAEDTPRMVRVFEDLQLWFRQMQQYEQVATDVRLAGYLGTFPQPPEIESQEAVGDDNGISLLTIHAAKGLEFEVVYLIGTTAEAWGESSLPRGVEMPKELANTDAALPPEHERRRLMYVAMTRAKQELIITAPVLSSDGRNRRTNPLVIEIFGAVPKLEAKPAPGDRLTQSLRSLEKYAPKTMEWTEDRLPFETSDGWLELSTTDLERYERCPYEFYLERVLKIRTPFGPQIAFGSLLHNLFRDYYQGLLGDAPVSLVDLQQRLEQTWSNRGYRSAEEAEVGLQLARETLAGFYAREESAKRKLRSSEEPFSLVIPEARLKIRGRIDLTCETPVGLEIRDFKTGRKRDTEKISADAKKSLQLRTYALALQEMTGAAPTKVVLDYVVTGVEGEAELSSTILKNHRAKLASIAEKIRKKEFAPNPDPFHNCSSYRYWGSGDDDA